MAVLLGSIGDLTPSEATELGKLIEGHVRALEAMIFLRGWIIWSAIDEKY